MSNKDKARNYAMATILILSVIDHMIALPIMYNAKFSLSVRPIVVFLFFSSVRNNFWVIL